jgi:hypothetical protein
MNRSTAPRAQYWVTEVGPATFICPVDQLDPSAVVSNIARSDERWVTYGRIGPDGVRVLLNAGMWLAEAIAEHENCGP